MVITHADDKGFPADSLWPEFWNFFKKLYRELHNLHCKWMNARIECNDIVIFIYSHYPLDPNAKLSDTKCFTLSIRWFCIRIERVMTVYENYDVIAFKSCIQKFTVYLLYILLKWNFVNIILLCMYNTASWRLLRGCKNKNSGTPKIESSLVY